jgi:hypothetical protein
MIATGRLERPCDPSRPGGIEEGPGLPEGPEPCWPRTVMPQGRYRAGRKGPNRGKYSITGKRWPVGGVLRKSRRWKS